jgi:hypothetical protein
MIGGPLLDDYLDAWRSRAFDWRASHCCHFGAGWVLLAEGVNPLQGIPDPRDERDALRLIGTLGGSLGAVVTARLGREPIPALMAARGDLVLVPDGERAGLGICNGRLTAVVTPAGLEFRETAQGLQAWRIGA